MPSSSLNPRRAQSVALCACLLVPLGAAHAAAAPASAAPHAAAHTPTAADPHDSRWARTSLRTAPTKERFYFVMADRFANGSTANDTGGLTGAATKTGFDPSHKGFFHGGDLKGLTDKLDYIKGMGTTAIWLTPSFTNKPVQGPAGQESAGYHGYWVTDFTRIDPHFGTNDEMKKLIAAAHGKGMKVYFDIITNHTADVINYAEKQYSYRDKLTHPYKDAAGKTFDDSTYAGGATFPKLDVKTSFPYTPVVPEAEKNVKVPAWLNDPTMYHNRGDTTFEGENSLYGDFFGLDDLFTERPEVVKGMGDIYTAWIDLGIDGFRIDTTRHVNMEFWQQFSPRMLAHAKKDGKNDFFMFGEVATPDATQMSRYTTTGKLPATLDFGFQKAVQDFAAGKPTKEMSDFYATDDLYTDADSNAYSLPTFTGNHDMGRLPMLLTKDGVAQRSLYKRVRLANELMFVTRGQPVVYYGDEQGFIGSGGDQDARQDMFPTKVGTYIAEPNLTGRAGSRSRFDTRAPLYRQISALAALRRDHPTLADGAQLPRASADSAGVFAVSRIDAKAQREYLVAANNSPRARTVTLPTSTSRARFAGLLHHRGAVVSDARGNVRVTVPALSTVVLRADRRIDRYAAAPSVSLTTAGAAVNGRTPLTVKGVGNRFVQATFLTRAAGTRAWTVLGTDDNAPHRVYAAPVGPKGSAQEFKVVVRDESGHVTSARTSRLVP